MREKLTCKFRTKAVVLVGIIFFLVKGVYSANTLAIQAGVNTILADGISSTILFVTAFSEPAISGQITVSLTVSGPGRVEPSTLSFVMDSTSTFSFSQGASWFTSTVTTGSAMISISAPGFDPGSVVIETMGLDSDGDGVFDFQDNCQSVHNPDQSDKDSDGFGDACDNKPRNKNKN